MEERIKLLQRKRRKKRITDKELIELGKITRTLASRQYRKRQSNLRKIQAKLSLGKSKGTVAEGVESLRNMVSYLESVLDGLLENETRFIQRDKEALAREE